MIQKIIRLSDFPLLNKLLTKGKTVLAHNKKNYYIELDQIKGDKIVNFDEIEANRNNGDRQNVIRLNFDTNKSKYFTVYNGEDGDKGNKGERGEKGYKGNSFDKRTMLNRAVDALVIANDDETNDSTAVWSAYRGKVMEDFLRSIAERIITDDEYQLLFNEQEEDEFGNKYTHQVFIDLEFVTKNENQITALVHRDTKSYKTYVKYWTYEDEGGETYYIQHSDGSYQELLDFDIWNDYYLNQNNDKTYYTRKLVITETDPITGEAVSSEYQYTPIIKPIWIDLEFTSTQEDQKSILVSNLSGDEDPADISKEEKEEEIIILHRPITSISIDGSGSTSDNVLKIPINSILTKAINIQPTDYLNSPICIEYDETKIKVFEDGRIMALKNNCETIIKIYSQENPEIYANIYVNVITYVNSIQFNTPSIKAFAGYTTTIEYTVLPETASNKTIHWSSDDESIAVVDQSGTITLKDVGTTTIYAKATDGSGKASRIDVIVDTAISDIVFNMIEGEVNPETNETTYTTDILVGIPTQIPVTILPENASNKLLVWESNNSDINIGTAENGIYGQIYMPSKTNGIVTVYPSDGSNVIKYLNVVGKMPVLNIMLNKTTATIDLGDTLQLTATVNENADNKNIIWTSSNTDLVTVDNNGLVTSIAGGNVTITATAADGSGVKASCDITSVVLITDIVFNDKLIKLNTIEPGNKYIFRKGNIDEGGNYQILPAGANITQLNWYTSDDEIAEINSSGVLTAKKEGKIKVYGAAMDNSGIIASADVIVTVPSTNLILSGDDNLILIENDEQSYYTLTLNVDQSYTLIATVIPDNTSLQNVEFTSLDPTIATVDSNGHITAISSGETIIVVKTLDPNILPLTKECNITVL